MSVETRNIESVLDLSTAMENLDGDAELLQEVVEIFLEMGPELLDELEAAVAAREVSDVDHLAHSLKGSASNFCAVKFVATAYEMEHLAKGGSLVGVEQLMQRLRDDFQALLDIQEAIDWSTVSSSWNG